MAAKAARGRKAAPAKAKAKAPGVGGKKIETPAKATFGVNDKRAQYARLVVFNFAVKQKQAGRDKDVNTVPNSVLESAGKSLAGGNLLAGPEGLELISQLSKAGATDEKVAKRGLTPAYAAEVRPFIKRLEFSDDFGRRKPAAKEKKAAPAKKKEEKKSEPAPT